MAPSAKKTSKGRTALDLDDDAQKLTKDEERAFRATLMENWAQDALTQILVYAQANKSFAESMCRSVADSFGPDDDLSAILTNRIKVDREGKTRGRHIKWKNSRYRHLIMLYNIHKLQGEKREDILKKLAFMEKFTGINATKKIEAKITEARKRYPDDVLPHGFQLNTPHQ